MAFNSFEFLFAFLPLTFLAVWTSTHTRLLGAHATVWILIAASFLFYAYSSMTYLLLFLILMTFNYVCGRTIAYSSTTFAKRNFLIMGCVANLLFLAYFKYRVFGANTINQLFGFTIHTDSLMLPLGISFFVFQKIGFLADSYAGKIRLFNFSDYCLFVSFFPQMIAGPIVHYPDMQSQFARQPWRKVQGTDLLAGISFICIGLFKKVVLSDNIAQFANTIFNTAATSQAVGFSDAWLGSVSFGLQIYFDFSGYSDIAIGLARLLGIHLPFNFNSPYKSGSIIEFWRRWHITLSLFLRDYLYIPLGGNRKGRLRRYLNLMITMALGGLWHGAAWTFICWGLMHGVLLTINHLWRTLFPGTLWPSRLGGAVVAGVLGWAVTFITTNLAWCLFRAPTFASAGKLLAGMFCLSSGGAAVLGWTAVPLIGAGVCWVTLLPNSQEVVDRILQRGSGALALIGAAEGVVFVCAVYFMMVQQYEQFIYFMF